MARRRGDRPGGQGLGPTRRQRTGTKNSCGPEGPGERELETGVELRGEETARARWLQQSEGSPPLHTQPRRDPPSASSLLGGPPHRSPTCSPGAPRSSSPQLPTSQPNAGLGCVTPPGQRTAAPTEGQGRRGPRRRPLLAAGPGPGHAQGGPSTRPLTPATNATGREMGARLADSPTGRTNTPQPLSRAAETGAEDAGVPWVRLSPQRGARGGNEGLFRRPGGNEGGYPQAGRRRRHPQLKTTRKLRELLAPRGPAAERRGPWGPPQTVLPREGPAARADAPHRRGRPSPLWAGRQRPSQCPRERARATRPSEGPSPWNASSRVCVVCLDSLLQTPGTHR